jgi:hypothetical protein
MTQKKKWNELTASPVNTCHTMHSITVFTKRELDWASSDLSLVPLSHSSGIYKRRHKAA